MNQVINKFTIQKSFVINAGAGSGKTYALSRRYINALLGFDFFREAPDQEQFYNDRKNRAADIKDIVTITYTEAAALEMKKRIFSLITKIEKFETLSQNDSDYPSIKLAFQDLDKAQKQYVANRLNSQIKEITHANISTIHAYCLDMIRRNSDLAQVDSGIEVIKSNEKINLVESIIFDVLDNHPNHPDIIEISNYISLYKINNFINKYLNDAGFRENFEQFALQDIERYKTLVVDIADIKPLGRLKEDTITTIKDLKPQFSDAGIEIEPMIQVVTEYSDNLQNFKAQPWKELEEKYNISIKFNRKPFTQKIIKAGLKPLINQMKAYDKKVVPLLSAPDIAHEKTFFDITNRLKTILKQIKERYDSELRGIKKVDFDSIIYIASTIIDRVDTNYQYVMVDEFQDTNEIQFNIIQKSLSKDQSGDITTNFFVVGDSKQSIYSFQGAELEVFNEAIHNRELFLGGVVNMDINFRSDGVVLDNINDIFQHTFAKKDQMRLIKQNYEADHQALKCSAASKNDQGSFRFLITPTTSQNPEGKTESKTLGALIHNIVHHRSPHYSHISDLIDQKQPAIAIMFDAKTKMLQLKQVLNQYGIAAKVSASEDFYNTPEVNDIFNVLKAINILSYMRYDQVNDHPFKLNHFQKFYCVGAYRSNILRIKDKEIKELLACDKIPENLAHYYEQSRTLTLPELIKYIYDHARLFDVYAHFPDLEQTVANLYKFLELAIEYETLDDNSLRGFLTLLEESIYFNEVNENEAFYKADNLDSIELCTIHSTKGLAYPMVILANSEKNLASQIAPEIIKHAKIDLTSGERFALIGYKIDQYIPISLRILTWFAKQKHMAEKKRLLYVALTRTRHDIIISAPLNKTQKNLISISPDSYLYMITAALKIPKDALYSGDIGLIPEFTTPQEQKKEITHLDFKMAELPFTSYEKETATHYDHTIKQTKNTRFGTLIHKIIEEQWQGLSTPNWSDLFQNYHITDQQEKVKASVQKFTSSSVYQDLCTLQTLNLNFKSIHFELPFSGSNHTGIIDLLYFDPQQNGWRIVDFKTGRSTPEKEAKYQQQIAFYQKHLTDLGQTIIDATLLWL